MNDSNSKTGIAVIGKDARQARLAALLASEGYAVRTAGIGDDIALVTRCATAAEASAGCRAVIFPVRHDVLNDDIEKIILPHGGIVFAWSPDASSRAAAESRGYRVFDLASDKALTVKNAHLTAEGALCLFMNEVPVSVLGSRVLVLGSGRVAKCVCRVFSSLGADVTMAARREDALAWASLSRWRTVRIDEPAAISRELASGYDAVINTVPDRVVSPGALPPGALYIELASAPHGVDLEAAAKDGVNVRLASSLPGKYAPESAAALICNTVRGQLPPEAEGGVET